MNKLSRVIPTILAVIVLFSGGCTVQGVKNQDGSSLDYIEDEGSDIYDNEIGGDMNGDGYIRTSILNDKHFEKGFYVRGLGLPIYDDPIETFGDRYETNVNFCYGQEDIRPDWHLCQWATRYPFHDINNTTSEKKNGITTFNYRYTKISKNHHMYENQSKLVEVNTKTGEVRLKLKASECYKYDRVAGEEWPHLLLEQDICSAKKLVKAAKVSDTVSIRVKTTFKMNSFKDNMGDRANEGLHSAMCLFYLFVANYDEQRHEFNDMLWFGIPVFDNRYVYSASASFPDLGSKESATVKWIYNIGGHEFYNDENNIYDTNGNIIFNEWKSIDVELIDLIKNSLSTAQKAGYMVNSKWENLYINGMYMGYETPGNYDIDMSFKNMDIVMEREAIKK